MTNKRLSKYETVLFEPVKGFTRLKHSDFEVKFEAEVAELDEVIVVWIVDPQIGEVLVLSNGLAIHVDKTNRYSLFETQERHNERTLLSAWAKFVRGCWTDRVPTEPGCYFVRDRDLGKRSMRELRRENGRLLDVSGGLVPPGRVTTWCGQWWSEVTPRLPNSY